MEAYLTYNEEVLTMYNHHIKVIDHKPSKSKLNKCKKGIHEYTKQNGTWICICGKQNNNL